MHLRGVATPMISANKPYHHHHNNNAWNTPALDSRIPKLRGSRRRPDSSRQT